MSLFLSSDERGLILSKTRSPAMADLDWRLNRRAERRAANPGLMQPGDTTDWWRPVAEYCSDAAMAHALRPSKALSHWLRDVAISLVRRPEDDWIGPEFRDHASKPPKGHLETAHLCWAVGAAVDLAPDVFREADLAECKAVLRERGIPLCQRWVETSATLANWRCVMTSGAVVAAAAIGDRELLAQVADDLPTCLESVQADGTSSESLQYGNYALYALTLAHEAVRRFDPAMAAVIPPERYAGYARWAVASYLYSKPLTRWGALPRARMLNFNDSGAAFSPTPDVLLHLAARVAKSRPVEAGLARWLYEQTATGPDDGIHDLSTFGFVPRPGFLSLPLFTMAAEPLSPADARLTEALAFDCGDSIARDGWGGRTVVGFHGGGEPLTGPGHLHGDVNSFILVHNRERLLVDPGHSCYRNAIHGLEVGTAAHNTCVFIDAQGKTLEQSAGARRKVDARTRRLDPPVDRGTRRLICTQHGRVRVVGSDSAALYGRPITRFSRFVLLCGSHAVFVIDWIDADEPVRTRWNWLLNNRDARLDLKRAGDDRIVARRGDAGMKLFHLAGGKPSIPTWAHVHDAYHPLPGQFPEGPSGSGVRLSWDEREPVRSRVAVHAIAVDGVGPVAGWHLKQDAPRTTTLEIPGESWNLQLDEQPLAGTVREAVSGEAYRLSTDPGGGWHLQPLA
jgi:hypothetical protein